MAWTLIEELVKATTVFLAGYLLSKTWRVFMDRTCCIKACQRLAVPDKRGLCLICYSKAKKKVEAGEVTWDKLVQMGLCTTDISDPFDDAYSQAMKE